MKEFVVKMKEMEEDIRFCYADPIKYNRDDFLNMILVYACFIIEFFLRLHIYDVEGRDPLLTKQWMLTDIQNDLILLENQLPFFVLEQFYNLTKMNILFPSFLDICFNYFKNLEIGTFCPMHFTNLLRFI